MGTMTLRSGGRFWRLVDLEPKWCHAPRGRRRVGISFKCPSHDGAHRLCVWFENPADGGPAVAAPALCWREGNAFDVLTVLGGNGERALAFPGHWSGWLVEGELHPSRFIPAEPDPPVDYGAPPAGPSTRRKG